MIKLLSLGVVVFASAASSTVTMKFENQAMKEVVNTFNKECQASVGKYVAKNPKVKVSAELTDIACTDLKAILMNMDKPAKSKSN